MFPGDSCYPLTPKKKGENSITISPFDQINVIFGIIGSPSEEDLFDIKNTTAREYVRNFSKKHPVDFSKFFPNTDPNLITLLKNMLEFNPKRRATIETILNNSIFNNYFNKETKIDIEAEEEICKIDFETEKFFLDQKDLNLLFLRELHSFRNLKEWEKIKMNIEILLKAISIK